MDHRQDVKLLNVTQLHQIIKIPKSLHQMEHSSAQELKFNVHADINWMVLVSSHVHHLVNGAVQ